MNLIMIIFIYLHLYCFPCVVPPTINSVSPISVEAIEGNSIELQFNITDADPLVNVSNIIWSLSSSFGSEDITLSSSPNFRLSPDRLTLQVINVQVSVHSGRYIITASNEAGTRSLSVDVKIESKCYRSMKLLL